MTQNEKELTAVIGAYVAGCGAAAVWYKFLGKWRFKLAMALLG